MARTAKLFIVGYEAGVMYVLAAIRADVVVSEARSTLVERKKDFVKECLHATTCAACGWKVGDVGERGRGKGARDKDDDGERKRERVCERESSACRDRGHRPSGCGLAERRSYPKW